MKARRKDIRTAIIGAAILTLFISKLFDWSVNGYWFSRLYPEHVVFLVINGMVVFALSAILIYAVSTRLND